MRKLIALTLIVIMVSVSAGIATYAWYTSSATSTDNTFISGTVLITNSSQYPTPLFSSNENDMWFVKYWYPGLDTANIAGQDRHIVIKNGGSLKARVEGISATAAFYTVDPQNPSERIHASADAAKEFKESLIVTVLDDTRANTLYTGTLADLMQDGYKKLNSNVLLQTSGSFNQTRLFFNVKMSEAAGNEIQGVTADVDIVIHATQEHAPIN
ncbi:MAG: hypothetical protein A2Y23_01180 [Clostridiales bacterium GWB2_37_7]|nr:MAG: hypothetical protein A2Y23_01180 [Clostridiales bacterium GWB2_37_7]